MQIPLVVAIQVDAKSIIIHIAQSIRKLARSMQRKFCWPVGDDGAETRRVLVVAYQLLIPLRLAGLGQALNAGELSLALGVNHIELLKARYPSQNESD
jgi:hypothetical protein